MKLNEILDTRQNYKVINEEDHLFTTRCKIGDRNIYFSAHRNRTGINNWSIQFYEEKPKTSKNNIEYNFELTGKGNEILVFSFVIQSLKDFVDVYRPDEFSFISSSGTNRSSLYTRLANRVKLPGYSFVGIDKVEKIDKFNVVRNRK